MNDLLFFPFHDYKKWVKEGFRTRDSHIFKELSKREDIGRILVLNRPVSNYEILLKKTSKKINISEAVYEEKKFAITKLSEKVYCLDYFPFEIMSPIWYRKDWWTKAYNSSEYLEIVEKSICILKISSSPLIYSNVVNNYDLIKELKKKFVKSKLVFDLVDDQTKIASGKYLKSIIQGYDAYAKIADSLIGTSDSLKSIVKRNITEITNGIDPNFINISEDGNENKTISLNEDLTGPIILYTGKIHKRIDFRLVEELVGKYPEYNFVFCGPLIGVSDFKKILKKSVNMTWLGDIHYSQLPKIINAAQVCIVPHLNNDLTKSQSPLKLLEYLSANKPVVTTPIKGSEKYDSNQIIKANTIDEFAEGIKYFVDNPDISFNFKIPETELWEYKVSHLLYTLKAPIEGYGNNVD